MITETNIMSEISEPTAIPLNINSTDEIKRNHLKTLKSEVFLEPTNSTDLSEKFLRLKKALRRRSSNIF